MAKAKTIEADIEQHLVKRAKEIDALCFKFVSPGSNGVPDRLLIYDGKHIFIELKAPKEKPRALQNEMHRKMRKHKATVLVIDSTQAIDELIFDLQHNRPFDASTGTLKSL